MAAFDRVFSGYETLDKVLDNIRLGDNVVWQVSSIEEYKKFALPFAKKAMADKKELIYIRFAAHPPILEPQDGLIIHQLDPEDGFENFTVQLHKIIEKANKDVFYIFDSLSELQVVWAADLMMGNFFQVTCPYLFELDTVAFFPILRGRHSFETVARIRETTQLLLDVYSADNVFYVHPHKVWNRYSATMFLPHEFNPETEEFSPITDGVSISRFYTLLEQENFKKQDQNLDSWERFFILCRLKQSVETLDKQTCDQLCRMLLTREKRMAELVEKYFSPMDYFAIRDRLIGTGTIGGKACGMLLARGILKKDATQFAQHYEPHDSYFIGSDVYYTYLVQNSCWKLRVLHRTEEGYFSTSNELKTRILNGKFSENLREQFKRILDHFGQTPIIVRSSSFLEDGFGNAFAGKYESVFCSNLGTPEERMEEFEKAIRIVYASTMDESALEYRRVRGLANMDEQMAILVQRVSGSRYNSLYFPSVAGVGYSYNAYRFDDAQIPEAGLIRMVMGLGTRAVDRTEGDYPRLVSLDQPTVTVTKTVSDKHKFSQRCIDVIDLENNKFTTFRLEKLLPHLPQWYQNLVLEHDSEAENMLRNQGRRQQVLFASCEGVVKIPRFIEVMQGMLKTLESAYNYPVDIEFTANFNEENGFMVNLVQCRPLQTIGKNSHTTAPNFDPNKMLFEIKDSSIGSPSSIYIDNVVFVNPIGYYNLPYNQKAAVARCVGEINRFFRDSNKKVMLMVPGRVGTSSPELGVPVSFAEVNAFCAICELAETKAGYMPELSYGSHMFQDLVESNILYSAIFESEKTKVYNPELLTQLPNIFDEICPSHNFDNDLIKVYQAGSVPLGFYLDIQTRRTFCGFTF